MGELSQRDLMIGLRVAEIITGSVWHVVASWTCITHHCRGSILVFFVCCGRVHRLGIEIIARLEKHH
jgi:hypothetical protein